MLALQVAFVALALGTVRVLRHRRSLVIVEPQLRFAANGAAVAALALAGAAFAELLVGWTRPAAAPWQEETLLLGLYGAAGFVSIVAALVAAARSAVRRRSRGRRVPVRISHRPAPPSPGTSPLSRLD